jgi:hypothetical protein
MLIVQRWLAVSTVAQRRHRRVIDDANGRRFDGVAAIEG